MLDLGIQSSSGVCTCGDIKNELKLSNLNNVEPDKPQRSFQFKLLYDTIFVHLKGAL